MYGMKPQTGRTGLGFVKDSDRLDERSSAKGKVSQAGAKQDAVMKDGGAQKAFQAAGANVKVSKPKRFTC